MIKEDRRTLSVAERVAAVIERERSCKASAHDSQAALLGHRASDCYLALQGVAHGLTPDQMGQIRQAELSEKGLSNGLGQGVAEDVEAQVGLAAKAHIGAITRLLEPALHTALAPPGRGSRWPRHPPKRER